MNNARVHDWAQGAIDKFNTYVVHENLSNAFGYLRDLRQAGNTDLELAAADHYLFARWVSCQVGEVPLADYGLYTASLGYDGMVKLWDTMLKKNWKRPPNQFLFAVDPGLGRRGN